MTTETETKTEQSPVEKLVDRIEKLDTSNKESAKSTSERLDKMEAELKKAAEVRYPYGSPGGAAPGHAPGGIIDPDRPSRPFSMMLVAKRLRMRAEGIEGWQNVAKNEAKLSEDLQKAYYGSAKWSGHSHSDFVIPLGLELMPSEDRVVHVAKEEGGDPTEEVVVPGIPKELRKRCYDMMRWGEGDPDEIRYYEKKLGYPLMKGAHFGIAKDLSTTVSTSGGTFVAEAAQGEMIEILRAQELFSKVGARQVDLPPQGSVTFPRTTGTVTVSATTEATAITESTPTTGQLRLAAKPYTALTDIPEELMMFSSVSIDAWLRNEMARESALKVDRDSINGAGGTAIQGVINFSGVQTRTAGTVAANGDTLDAPDPMLLFGDIADQDAPVDTGFFFALTNSLWAGLTTRQATTNEFIFSVSAGAAGGGGPAKSMAGHQVVCSTQVPTDRSKGSSSNLTILLGGVGSEWIIARAGILTVKMTDSDASKFASRLSTMRSTQYVDAGPRHENSFGYIDDVTNS